MKIIENGENLSELKGRWTPDMWMPPVYPRLATTAILSRVVRNDQVLIWSAVVTVAVFLCGMLYQHQRTVAKLTEIQSAVSHAEAGLDASQTDRRAIHRELERKVTVQK